MNTGSTQDPASENHHVTRSSRHVSMMIMLSRVLGLLRDKALVLFFGGMPWMLDSFLLAFTIPNLFRRIFGEGALTAAFLPQYIEARNGEPAEVKELSASVLSLLLAVTGMIAGLGMAGCGIYLAVGTPTPQISLTLRLLILMLPFLTLICTSAYLSAMLQGAKKFTIPAAMSIFLNLCFLTACGFLAYMHWPTGPEAVDLTFWQKLIGIPLRLDEAARVQGLSWVAYAVLAAGLLQILIQWPIVRATGVSLGLGINLKNQRVRAVLLALAPTALGLGIVQLNVLVDNLIAYSLSLTHVDGAYPYQGATTYLYLGNRLMQLPLGVFGVALATTAFPFLAEYASKKKATQYLDCLHHSIRMLAFIVLPASFGLIVMASPLVRLLYQEPDLRFTDAAVYRSAAVLCCYAGGLIFFSINQMLTRAFYARQDYRTPVRIAVWMVVVNLVLNLVLIHAPDLYRHWGHVTIPGLTAASAWGQGMLDNSTQGLALGEAGLALATSLTAALNCLLLWFTLRKQTKIGISDADWEAKENNLFASLCWIFLAAVGMGVATYWVRNSIPYGPELIWRAEKALVPIVAGIIGYAIVCMILSVKEYGEFMGRIRHTSKPLGEPNPPTESTDE